MRTQPTTVCNVGDLQEKWYIVDAEGLIVGRIATRVASLVRGKTTPGFSPHQDPKVHVIITNADKAIFSGKKLTDKMYHHHSGWRTGLKSTQAKDILAEKPEHVLRKAIHGMLPKGPLGRKLNTHLRIYTAGKYNGQHDAQKPETLVIKTRQPKAKA